VININNLIERIIIEKGTEELSLTKLILSRLKDKPSEIVEDIDELVRGFGLGADSRGRGKRELLIAIQRGRFFKPCPGTKDYLCCLYKILHNASNCPVDCSYCILQCYFNNPFLIVYANEKDLFSELGNVMKSWGDEPLRLGTGEFTDSLILDPITEFSKRIIPFVLTYPNIFLELKTKSSCIENVLEYNGQGRVFLSWSLNPPEIIESEEKFSADLNERLISARKCQDAGFPLCFHFDPIIRFDGWENAYRKTIKHLFEMVDPKRIVWISLGCLRFPPALKEIIQERFPGNRLLYEEFIIGTDGKMRYFKPLRIKTFKFIYEEIKRFAPEVFVYLCMESKEVWEKVFGWAPGNNYEFGNRLDERCKLFG